MEAPPGLPPGAAIEAREAAGEAVAAFIAGDLEAAEARFDAARALNPELRPYLWQRGITKVSGRRAPATRSAEACRALTWPLPLPRRLSLFLIPSRAGSRAARPTWCS